MGRCLSSMQLWPGHSPFKVQTRWFGIDVMSNRGSSKDLWAQHIQHICWRSRKWSFMEIIMKELIPQKLLKFKQNILWVTNFSWVIFYCLITFRRKSYVVSGWISYLHQIRQLFISKATSAAITVVRLNCQNHKETPYPRFLVTSSYNTERLDQSSFLTDNSLEYIYSF